MPKTRISCPNCRQPIVAEIDQLIDVGQDAKLKQKFLSGQINYIQCPQCEYKGTYSTAIVYHDPDKELLLTHVPHELGLPINEQERLIGSFITQVINKLPQEKRKGYLLRPKPTFTYQSLMEMVLEADGITKEMIQAQQKRLNLIQELVSASESQIEEIVKRDDALMDREFFLLLRQISEAATMSNEQATAVRLVELQKKLITLTTYGKVAQEKAQEIEEAVKELKALGDNLTREKLIDLMINAKSETRLQTYVSLTRPGIDYEFYQLLSDRIDRSRGDGRNRLVELREKLLELTKLYDQEVEARHADARKELNEILGSPDIKAATIQALPHIDEFFVNEVNAALEKANNEADLSKIDKLQQIIKVIQESNKPPKEIEFIETLLSAKSENELRSLLDEHQEQITPEFMEVFFEFVNQAQSGDEPEFAKQISALYRFVLRFSMSKNMKK
jgi:hypothetical protein